MWAKKSTMCTKYDCLEQNAIGKDPSNLFCAAKIFIFAVRMI